MKNKNIGWLVLGIIAVLAGIALAVTNALTEGPIAQQNQAQANESIRALLPEADTFADLDASQAAALDKAFTALKGEEIVGYAAQTTVQGYAGPIEVIIGMNPQGELTCISVGGSAFAETEGVGSKTRDEAFTSQFVGKTPPLTLGEEIDGVSGATISSRAVTQGVNTASEALTQLAGMQSAANTPQAAKGDTTHVNASKWGYAGPVLASVSFAPDGSIAALSIGDARFAETDGVGARVREEGFVRQFVGKTPPLQASDIDIVSGATVSSTAALEAVNAAYEYWRENK